MRISTTVTPLPRRRPQKIAREIVTLDQLSNGRFTLGVGLGAPPELEFELFGEDSNLKTRAEKLDESLEILEVSGLANLSHIMGHITKLEKYVSHLVQFKNQECKSGVLDYGQERNHSEEQQSMMGYFR